MISIEYSKGKGKTRLYCKTKTAAREIMRDLKYFALIVDRIKYVALYDENDDLIDKWVKP